MSPIEGRVVSEVPGSGGDGRSSVGSPEPLAGGQGTPARARLEVARSVVLATARLAVAEVPGVARIGRGGSLLRRLVVGRSPLRLEHGPAGLEVRLVVVVRPGESLGAVGRAVAAAVRGAVERVLGLEVARVTVVVDGVAG